LVIFLSCLGIIINFNVCVDPNEPCAGFGDINNNNCSIPCEGFVWYQAPPFFPANNPVNMWTMSENFPAFSFAIFTGGFSLFLYSIFYYVWDIYKVKPVALFRTLGTNSLLVYCLNYFDGLPGAITPRDSPGPYVVFVGFPLYFGLVWTIIRYFENNQIYIAL